MGSSIKGIDSRRSRSTQCNICGDILASEEERHRQICIKCNIENEIDRGDFSWEKEKVENLQIIFTG